MRALFVGCALLLCSGIPAWAHPAVGIVMDGQGNVFYSDLVHVWRIAPDGRNFNHRINWIAAARDGSLYVVDGSDLRRISREGHVTIVKRDVGPQMMGLCLDARNNVYVAVYGSRAIVRVSADGRVATVARTPEPWGPSGVLIAPNGDLWALEYSTFNQARVRRIAVNGRVTIF